MSNMGIAPPDPDVDSHPQPPEPEYTPRVGPPQVASEVPSAEFAGNEIGENAAPQQAPEDIERARQIMQELSQDAGSAGDAKELATLTLSRLAVPGDTALHEAVFRMAEEMAAGRQG